MELVRRQYAVQMISLSLHRSSDLYPTFCTCKLKVSIHNSEGQRAQVCVNNWAGRRAGTRAARAPGWQAQFPAQSLATREAVIERRGISVVCTEKRRSGGVHMQVRSARARELRWQEIGAGRRPDSSLGRDYVSALWRLFRRRPPPRSDYGQRAGCLTLTSTTISAPTTP